MFVERCQFGVVYSYVAVRIWGSVCQSVVHWRLVCILKASFVMSAETGDDFGESDELKAYSTLCRG